MPRKLSRKEEEQIFAAKIGESQNYKDQHPSNPWFYMGLVLLVFGGMYVVMWLGGHVLMYLQAHGH